MSRTTRIAVGLLVPSLIASFILALVYTPIKAMKDIDPRIVLVMLAFIVTSVASSTFTAYIFKGLEFKTLRIHWAIKNISIINWSIRPDILLVYLNSFPWVTFVFLFSERFWVLAFPIFITPLLGYWFGKRFFSL